GTWVGTGDTIHRATRPKIAARRVQCEAGSEPPCEAGENFAADVIRLRFRLLASEDRNETTIGQWERVLLDGLGHPVRIIAAVHAERRRPGIGGPGADLDPTVLVPADRAARVGVHRGAAP